MPRTILPACSLVILLMMAVGGCRKPDEGKGNEKDPNVPLGPALGETSGVTFLTVSPDAKLVAATWGNPRGVGIWELTSGKPQCKTLSGYYERLVFSADSKQLIGMGTTEDKMAIWDAATGAEIRSAPLPPWKADGVATLAPFLALSADGKQAISIHNAKKLVKLGLSDAKLESFPTDVTYFEGAAYSASADSVIAVQFARPMLLVQKADGKEPGKKTELATSPRSLALAADGKTVAVALDFRRNDDKATDKIELYDTANWTVRTMLPKTPTPDFRCYAVMALTGDGKYLAGVPYDETKKFVEIWDVAAQTVRKVHEGSRGSTLAFTPDGTKLVIGFHDAGVKTVDTE